MMTSRDRPVLLLLLLLLPAAAPAQSPDGMVLLGRSEVLRWDFRSGNAGWKPILDAAPGGGGPVLRILSRGTDPALTGPEISLDAASRRHAVRLRLKTPAGGTGQLFWATDAAPAFEEARSVRFPLGKPGAFVTCEIPLAGVPAWTGRITRLRLDPGGDPGPVEIEWIAIDEIRLHPLALGPGVQEPGPTGVRVTHQVTGHEDAAQTATVRVSAPEGVTVEQVPERLEVPPRGRATLSYTVRAPGPGVFPVEAVLEAPGAPPLRRRVTVRIYPTLQQFVGGAIPGETFPLTEEVTAVAWRTAGAPPSLLFYHARARGTAPAAELAGPDRIVVAGADGAREELALPTEAARGSVRNAKGEAVGLWEWSHARQGRGLRVRAAFRPSADTRLLRFEGIVLRIPGRDHDGALFSGLEFLGPNEASSSTADIDPPDHLRAVPDPLKITMPLMGAVKDGAAIGLAWTLRPATPADAAVLQPAFHVPDTLDGEPNLRMSLSLPPVGPLRPENAPEAQQPLAVAWGGGVEMEATFLLLPGADLGGLIAAWLKDNPLPPPPVPPRDEAGALALARASLLESALWDPARKGWGHCAEPNWERHPFLDLLGALWKLGLLAGAPDGPEARRVKEVLDYHKTLPPGGAHLPSRMIPFTLGPVDPCLAAAEAAARAAMARQRADGLWTYEGRFRRGHTEDTASGFAAAQALPILEHARMSLDPASRAAGLQALEAMRRFRVPRGAQTWELSLHTPDILAAAHLVGAYVRGYELTRNPSMLERARYWALTGLPFVYLWDRADLPTMRYATIAVYGATHWKAPNWIGLPVQWCGTVYARRILELAPHDPSVDWRRVAAGIAGAAERMQYPDGPKAGCLPDFFHLAAQRRDGPSINPAAVLALRLALAGDRLDAETDFVAWQAQPLAVTTVARDVRGEVGADGALTLRGRFHPGAQVVWALAGAPALRDVTVNGAPAPRVEAWPADGNTWRRHGGWILVRIAASKGEDVIRLR